MNPSPADEVQKLLEEVAESDVPEAQLDSLRKAKEIPNKTTAVVDKISTELLITVEKLRDGEVSAFGLQWLQEMSLQSKPLMVKTARLALWLFMDPASGAAVRKKVLEMFTLFFENVLKELSRFTYSLEESSLISSICGVIFSFVKHLRAKLPGDIQKYPGGCRLRIYRFLAGCAVQAHEWAKVPTKRTHLLHGKAVPQLLLEYATKERCNSLLDMLWLMLKANGSSPTDDMAVCSCIWLIAKNCFPVVEANRISDAASYIVAVRLHELTYNEKDSVLSRDTKLQYQRSFFYLHKSCRKELLCLAVLKGSKQAAQDSTSPTLKLPGTGNLLRPYITLPPKDRTEPQQMRAPVVSAGPDAAFAPRKRKRRCYDSSDEEAEDAPHHTNRQRSRENMNNMNWSATQGSSHDEKQSEDTPARASNGSPLKTSFERMNLNGMRAAENTGTGPFDAPQDPRLRARPSAQPDSSRAANAVSDDSSLSSPTKNIVTPLVLNYIERRRTLLPTPTTPPKKATLILHKSTTIPRTSPGKSPVTPRSKPLRSGEINPARQPILPPSANDRSTMVTSPSSRTATQRPRIEAKRPVFERLGEKGRDLHNEGMGCFSPVFEEVEHRLEQFGNRSIAQHWSTQQSRNNIGLIRRLHQPRKKNVHVRLGCRTQNL
ncbi:hypothetical protein RvY_09573 [Ramazzottius varieornatus]|uniref:Uncharacterized protein n=1 Tax=Ramazzottius varieornatus TaxID=947166 RepID=A0A1D1V9Q7_RAMVA|nr:hypothetical protein RvY_09573 [Ramazzottius varieornatus]